MMLVACVAVEKTSLHFDQLFDYYIPSSMTQIAQIGCRVSVPFGTGSYQRQGIIMQIKQESPYVNLKTIYAVLDHEPVLSNSLLDVVRYLHHTCFCTWFEAVRTILPTGLSYSIQERWQLQMKSCNDLSEEACGILKMLQDIEEEKNFGIVVDSLFLEHDSAMGELMSKGILTRFSEAHRKVGDRTIGMVRLTDLQSDPGQLTFKQKKVYDFLKENPAAAAKEVCYLCGVTMSVIKNLIRQNIVTRYEKEVYRNPYANQPARASLEELTLTQEQQKVCDRLTGLLDSQHPCVSLLRGVTGSGKTQIFVKLIEHTIQADQQCILLVPEISLTSQMIAYFQSLFGNQIAVLHSGLSVGEQLDEYKRALNGDAKIVIGTRSAVFAPLNNIGLIIMDEEGERTYKSSDLSPRYHARDVAKYRCIQSKALLLLASATPSIESQYYAQSGKYQYFELNERYGKARLPETFMIDLRSAKPSQIAGVSQPLAEELLQNLQRKEQSILFLNRRGYNSSLICAECGWVSQCPHCSASMTYHQVNHSLMCHYCGYIQPPNETCSVCGSKHMIYHGHGTQKIEEDLAKAFPSAKILRMDADTTFNRAAMDAIVQDFTESKYDILVGTQMVAKGFNFPNVTLVGVLLADGMLYGADFRCHEQFFSLLTQVVGRSGRANKAGRAMIQTYHPDNATLLQAAHQDYMKFYQDEIEERKSFFCPPFCDLCIVNFSGVFEDQVHNCASRFIQICRENANASVPLQVLGISTPFLYKASNRYRKRVIIKCRNNPSLRDWVRNAVLQAYSEKIFSHVRISVDINGDIT